MTYTIKDLLQLKECDDFTRYLTDKALNKPLIGAIFWVDLNLNRENFGKHVQGGVRPCVIISNHIEHDEIQSFNVVPLSTQLKAPHLPTHVIIEPTLRNGLKSKSMAINEQLTTIDSSFIRNPIGMIDYRDYLNISKSMFKNLGCSYSPNDDYFELIDKLFVGVSS